ncbi:MAG: hypothetical protein JSS60_07330 [Verrucomicrobia bacterium]|nr:hypothetical protein [Verrucomicrobiota bacterium]
MLLEPKLLSLSHRGIFPGPSESREDFIERAETLSVKLESPHLDALNRVKKIFISSPDWVEIAVQSKGLLPWEAAAAWIEEKEGVRTCRIQIKNSFPASLYPQEEVLAHEMVHAMRLMFDERRFEEVLAYRTSSSRFRRYFGPLFSDSRDLKILFSLFLIPWILYGVEVLFDIDIGGSALSLLPLLGFGWGLLRLFRTQRIFKRALRNVEEAMQTRGASLAVVLRLSDQEIELFAEIPPLEIRSYAANEKDKSVRWTQLYNAYFT